MSELNGAFQAGPAADEVHCWSVCLDVPPEALARLYATLAVDERQRSARFRFERDRRWFIVAHGALRDILGRYLRMAPERIGYVYRRLGKPGLDPRCGAGLEFNLSHSAGFALIAIAAESDIGVDLERIRAYDDCAMLAECWFSAAEVCQLRTFPEHHFAEAFIRCWTKKEAYLKATGAGLATPLDSFAVPVTADVAQDPVDLYVSSNDLVLAKRWSFFTLQPSPGYVGALAVEGGGWRLRQWQWPAV